MQTILNSILLYFLLSTLCVYRSFGFKTSTENKLLALIRLNCHITSLSSLNNYFILLRFNLMRINHRNISDLILHGRVIERVEELCCLGSMVSHNGGDVYKRQI